jgi:uracil-DNA glycosylase
MSTNRLSPAELFRRYLVSQMELGEREVILEGPTQATAVVIADSSEGQKNLPPLTLSSSIPTGQYGSITEHNSAICNCQLCPLGKTRTRFVYGVGNPHARLMFIGEAPGADEDRLGEPFVGRAGQLLDKIMAAIQLTRQDVYIANILKCRPPNNREPQPDEVEKCLPYLKEQIRLIQPKLICLLGRSAAIGILQKEMPLGKMRGYWHEFESVPVMVTYHPAALLRNPAYKKDTWEDMQKLRARYDSLGA